MDTSASLLQRLRTPSDEAAWRQLDELYRPLIHRWLLRDPQLGAEADDLVQDVMGVLVRKLPDFQRRRKGSFRRWLRTITVNRLSAYHRSRKNRAQPMGVAEDDCPLSQLADPNSELSHQWDEEHDLYVLRRLLELIEPRFERKTLRAFQRVALEGVAPTLVAKELGMSYAAVVLAKSHVLQCLREEAKGFID